MKKRCLMLVAAILLLCLLVGCSAQKDQKKDTAGTTEAVKTQEAGATDTQKPTEAPTEAPTETEETPAFKLDCVWRSEQEDAPEKGRIIRELAMFTKDSQFMFRCGDPDSEFSYWLVGTWTLKEDQLHLDAAQTDEMGDVLTDIERVKATYRVETDGKQLILTPLDDAGLLMEDPGVRIVFEEKPAEED